MTTLGISFIQKRKVPARGVPDGLRTKIAIGFDPDEFKKISTLAHKKGLSMQEFVRRLCAAGLKIETT